MTTRTSSQFRLASQAINGMRMKGFARIRRLDGFWDILLAIDTFSDVTKENIVFQDIFMQNDLKRLNNIYGLIKI